MKPGLYELLTLRGRISWGVAFSMGTLFVLLLLLHNTFADWPLIYDMYGLFLPVQSQLGQTEAFGTRQSHLIVAFNDAYHDWSVRRVAWANPHA